MPSIHYSGIDASGTSIARRFGDVDTFPDKCPACGSAFVPENFPHGFLAHDQLQTLHHCPNRKCDATFASLYMLEPETPGKSVRSFKYERILPFDIEVDAVDPRVAAFSPHFKQIMITARLSVDWGDPEKCGPYQRIALELLVLEYARAVGALPAPSPGQKQPSLAEAAACLKNDLGAFLLKRAAWLGSAGAPVWRWSGQDGEPLRRIIAAVQHYIVMQLIDKELDADLAPPAPAQGAPAS